MERKRSKAAVIDIAIFDGVISHDCMLREL